MVRDLPEEVRSLAARGSSDGAPSEPAEPCMLTLSLATRLLEVAGMQAQGAIRRAEQPEQLGLPAEVTNLDASVASAMTVSKLLSGAMAVVILRRTVARRPGEKGFRA